MRIVQCKITGERGESSTFCYKFSIISENNYM